MRRGRVGRRAGGGAALADGVGDGFVADRPHGGQPAGGRGFRAARRARAGHAGQPGRARRHLERRRGARFAHHAFRGVLGRGAAGRGGGGPADRRAAAGCGPTAGAGGGVGAGPGGAGDRPGPAAAQHCGRHRARLRAAARRPEMGGAGDAGLRTGGGRRGGDAAPVATAVGNRGPGVRLLPRAAAGVARPGLGCVRQGGSGAVSARLDRRRRGDQRTGRGSRIDSGVARRHHAAVLLVGPRAGTGPAAALGARRRAEHR
ncbi:hypothetical protein MCOL_V202410 [Mycobacterium colombiense CECT 3035]|uniref:Uncharacterized protein n=1 Tax=Mycobacterium colombiense CECT 3035 TaxID=1041522 RepID=J4SKM1_9MYCO|nr:hypothetical protein MCOL_V202410 [Mycobacterium colombiense CECT 3035]